MNGDASLATNCEQSNASKWYLFNDSDVKQFDSAQLAAECFGGETTSKTYDSASEKFMDLSFEKTNSAYMLFYEKRAKNPQQQPLEPETNSNAKENELFKTIWHENMQLIADRYTFDTGYYGFMWQMCDILPTFLSIEADFENKETDRINLLSAKLAITHILDTYVHSKDKANLLNWNDLLQRLFASSSASMASARWLLNHLIVTKMNWCIKLLLKCPAMSIRHILSRLLVNVLLKMLASDDLEDSELVEKFFSELLGLLEYAVSDKCNVKFMHEFFGLFYELAKQGGAKACTLLIKLGLIQNCVEFYVLNRQAPSKIAAIQKEACSRSVLSNGVNSKANK